MTYRSRIDWCVVAGILLAVAAVGLGASYWIGGPVLLVLLLCAYPKTYETAGAGLVVRDALARRAIPWAAITYAEAERWGALGRRHAASGGAAVCKKSATPSCRVTGECGSASAWRRRW